MSTKFFTNIHRALNFGVITSALVMGLGWVRFTNLPDASKIDPAVANEPEQKPLKERAFQFDYEGSSYQVEPHAMYSIKGLVVTHNNVAGIGDAYHTSKSVDLKDVCVLWGDNAVNPNLTKIKFWSEPWTCNYWTDDQAAFESFRQDQFSNNHLLAPTPQVRDLIRSVKVGDQIEITGKLVDYYPHGASESIRRTSLTREDTGNGACEVVYVEDLRVIKAWDPFFNELFRIGKKLVILFLALRILGFVVLPWLEYRYG